MGNNARDAGCNRNDQDGSLTRWLGELVEAHAKKSVNLSLVATRKGAVQSTSSSVVPQQMQRARALRYGN